MIDRRSEILLSRYLDDEVTLEERNIVERRLARDPELRAELADLVLLKASVEMGLKRSKQAGREAELPEQALPRALASSAVSYETRPRRRALGPVLAAAAVVGVGIGVFGWWTLRGRTAKPAPARYSVAHTLAMVEATPAGLDVKPSIAEALGPETPLDRRKQIYRAWGTTLDPKTFEALAWTIGGLEPDPTARAILYIGFSDRPAFDDTALLAASRTEWERRAFPPLVPLISKLARKPTPETARFFAEILAARSELEAQWLSERLPVIQGALPNDATIESLVTRAMESDPEDLVRGYACLARAALGDRRGIDLAFGLLQSPVANARSIAVTTIGRHGLTVEISRLGPLLLDEEATVRDAAKKAFADRNVPEPIPKQP